jgi:hypothetical protein
MPISEAHAAPYAPPSAIIDFVSRYRNRNVPFPVTGEVLARIGISPSLTARTLQSLQTLDLVNKEGNPTETLEGIRLAPEAEYKDRFANWLKSSYAPIFAIVDPTKDDAVRIRDAFRGFNPIGQQDRMVILFEGLCAEAGLTPAKPPIKKATVKNATATIRSMGKVGVTARVIKAATKANLLNAYGLPPAIAGLMESLPSPDAGWTAAERAKFLKTFESVLDFSIPIMKEKKEPAEK